MQRDQLKEKKNTGKVTMNQETGLFPFLSALIDDWLVGKFEIIWVFVH